MGLPQGKRRAAGQYVPQVHEPGDGEEASARRGKGGGDEAWPAWCGPWAHPVAEDSGVSGQVDGPL